MNAWRRFAEALDLEIDRGSAAPTFAYHAGAFELFEKGGGFGRAVFERVSLQIWESFQSYSAPRRALTRRLSIGLSL